MAGVRRPAPARRALAALGHLTPRPRGNASADPVSILKKDLAHLGARGGKARALLTALAWARGPGLPAGPIWLAMAEALAEDAGLDVSPFTGDDLAWLTRAAARHVTGGPESAAGAVYQLREETVAAHLRGESASAEGDTPAGAAQADGDGSGGRGGGRRRRSSEAEWRRHRWHVERALTAALLRTVPSAADGTRDWQAAHPYSRLYLARHAAAGGAASLLRVLEDPGFLAAADPASLTPVLDVTDPALRAVARLYWRAAPMLGADPAVNAAALRETAAALHTEPPLGLTAHPRPAYRPLLVAAAADESLLTLTGHHTWVQAVAAADLGGQRVFIAAACEDGTVWRWDPHTGAPFGPPLTGPAGWLNTVDTALAPDGTLLVAAAGEDALVWVWDGRTGTPVGPPLAGHTDAVLEVTFGTVRREGAEGDGVPLLASASRDRTVRIWDPLAGVALGEPLTGHDGWAEGVAFTPAAAGTPVLATSGADQTIRLWDPLSHEPAGEPLTGFGANVRTLKFGRAPDGRVLLALVLGKPEHAVLVWDLHARTLAGPPLRGHTDRVESVSFATAPDGGCRLVTASRDGTARVWDPATGEAVRDPLVGHTGGINWGCVTPPLATGPLVITGSDDRTVRLWDPVAPPVTAARHAGRWVDAVALGTAAGGQQLAAAAGADATRVWDLATGVAADALAGQAAVVKALAFGTLRGTPFLASAGHDRRIRLWDPGTGAPLAEPLAGHTARVTALASGADGAGRPLLASGGEDTTIRLWDLAGDAPPRVLAGHGGFVGAVTFGTGATGPLLASASGDGTVRIWDPATGDLTTDPLTGHTGAVRTVAYGATAAGPLLASGGEDRTVRLWDPLTGTPAAEPLTGHESWINAVAMTTVGGQPLLLSGGADATVRVWDPVRLACRAVLRRRSPVRSLAAAGPLLAIGDDEGISVLELDAAWLA